jgi:hypothetical protein
MPVGQPIALQVGDKVQLGHTTLILVDTRAGWIHEPPPPMPIEAPPPSPPPQQRNLGFSLAMIGLAGLGFLACAIIAALVLGFVNDFRSDPQLPDENLPTQTPADTSQTPFDRPGQEIWSLGNGEGQILLDLTLVGEAENGAIVEENCTATIETRGSGLTLEAGSRAPPDMRSE